MFAKLIGFAVKDVWLLLGINAVHIMENKKQRLDLINQEKIQLLISRYLMVAGHKCCPHTLMIENKKERQYFIVQKSPHMQITLLFVSNYFYCSLIHSICSDSMYYIPYCGSKPFPRENIFF